MSITSPAIELQDVSYQIGENLILDHINFSVKNGEYLGIIGPNGGGKTTLLKIILGLLTPSSGEIKLFGKAHAQMSDRYLIGYVPQRVAFSPQFPATVEEVVSSGRTPRLGYFKFMGKEDKDVVARAMKIADVTHLKNSLIGNLSGGQRQRVYIARALAAQPKILILDEPSVGVDVGAQQLFYAFLQKLNSEHGITIVFVSHDIDVIADEARCVLCLNRTLICQGPPKQLFTPNNLQKLYGKAVKFVVHGHHHA